MINQFIIKLKTFFQIRCTLDCSVDKSMILQFELNKKDFKLLTNNTDQEQLKMLFSNHKKFTIKNQTISHSGLYRLIDFKNGGGRQFNILSGNVINDLISLMPCFDRGNRDDYLSYKQKTKKLFIDNLSLTCGPVSRFVKSWLEEFYPNVEARIVHWFTEKEMNEYDNGHTCLEVYIEKFKKWIVFDFNRACLYKQDKVYLSALECNSSMNEDLCYINHVVDPSFNTKGISYVFFEKFMKAEDGKKTFLDRIFGVCIIEENERFYAVGRSNKDSDSIIRQHYNNIKLMTQNEFEKKFYSKMETI